MTSSGRNLDFEETAIERGDCIRAYPARQDSQKRRCAPVFVILAPVLDIFYVLVVLQLALGLYSLWDGFVWFRMVRQRLASHAGFYAPMAAVLCPCRGIESGLEENLAALARFDYPNYEIYFSVA